MFRKNNDKPKLIKTLRYEDARGLFTKVDINQLDDFKIIEVFSSTSNLHVLRGMHFQNAMGIWQRKIVTVIQGEILDVIVNINPSSKDYKKVNKYILNSKSNSLFIPGNYAHGFLTLTDTAIVQYLCDQHHSTSESGILWDSIDFQWPIIQPILSDRDQKHEEL